MLYRLRYTIVSLLLLLTCSAHAQVGEQHKRMMIGVNGGYVLNSMNIEPNIMQSMHGGPKMGVSFQVMSERYFKAYCSLLIELNYASLGWKEKIHSSQDEPLPDTYQRHLNYLQFPFLAKLGWGKAANGWMGYLVAGPQIGYLLSESSKKSEEWTLNSSGHPDRPNHMYQQYDLEADHKVDYGIVAGAGVDFYRRKQCLSLDVRYYYGLADVFGNSKKDIFGRSAHGSIMLTLGYHFRLGKK